MFALQLKYSQQYKKKHGKKDRHYGPKIRERKYKTVDEANMACRILFHDTIYHTLGWSEYMILEDDYEDGDENSWDWLDETCHPTVTAGKYCYSYDDDYGDGWKFSVTAEVIDSGLYSRKFVTLAILALTRKRLYHDVTVLVMQYLGIMDSTAQVIPGSIEPYN